MDSIIKKKFIRAVLLSAAFILFVILLLTVDVQTIGAENTKLGLSSLNIAMYSGADETGVFYTISEVLGYAAIALAALFAMYGMIQLIRMRDIKKVDRSLLLLGGLYVAVLVLYAVFDKFIIINYRPLIEEGGIEPSFPSSHTMISCCVFGSAAMALGNIMKNPEKAKLPGLIFIIAAAVVVCTRYLSGVHWFTDILGGLLISAALLSWFDYAMERFGKKKSCRKPKTADYSRLTE